jgi:hypothetical protein
VSVILRVGVRHSGFSHAKETLAFEIVILRYPIAARKGDVEESAACAYRSSGFGRSCGPVQQKSRIPETRFPDLLGKRGVQVTAQRTGGIGVRESGIRESSDSRPREYRFPDRVIPDRR